MIPQSPAPEPAPEAVPATAEPPAIFRWRRRLVIMRSHWMVALTLAAIAGTLAAWMQMRRPKMYEAQSTLFLERAERRIDADAGEYMPDVNLLTRLEQIRGVEMAQRVAASLTPEEQAIVMTRPPGAKVPAKPRPIEQIVGGAMSFSRPLNTMLISVEAVHNDPRAAVILANRYAEQFIKYVFDRTNSANDASLSFLRGQAEEFRKKSEASERQLQDYRQKYNLVSLEANQNIIVDNLKSLNGSVTTARVARLATEAKLAQAEAVIKRGGDAGQLASIATADALADSARRIAELRAKRLVMAERYGRRHPAMQENERSIDALEKQQKQQIDSVMASLRDQQEKAAAEERQLSEQLAKAEKEALSLDQVGVEYSILRRTVESEKTIYAQTLSRINDATISAQLRGVNIKVSALATLPEAPYSPNLRSALLYAGCVSGLIFFGYPFLAELFFGRVRSSFDVEYHVNVPLLGEIGSVRRIPEKDRPFLVKSEQDEGALEQFRALYAQFRLNSRIDAPKSVLITSSIPGEGKSFIAANLASCMVAHGQRVLLVDLDLRRPKQHRQFGLPSDRGILRWLEAGAKVAGDILVDENLGITEMQPGLFVLGAGGSTRKATELMEAGQLNELFAALRSRFDVLLLDTPPAGIFPDALVFAKVAQEVIYVCRFNAVSRTALRDTLQRLLHSGAELPGIVLNAMPTGFASGHYYKGYGYNQARYYSKHYQQEKES